MRSDPQEVKEVLEATEEYIKEHGWTRRSYENEDGAVCLVGALHRSVFGKSYYFGSYGAKSHCQTLYDDAYLHLLQSIKQSPEGFNDSRKTSRRVYKALRQARNELGQ